MAAQPVEWVMVVYYGKSAHRATYGRKARSKKYSKDYIQLHRNRKFLDTFHSVFPATIGRARVDLKYQWLSDKTRGAFDYSKDRWHLKWDINSAPKAWKMALAPSEATAETIPGDPSHVDFASAENELESLPSLGAGQPYLVAVKLRDESNNLHVRAYLKNPSADFAWADLGQVPLDIQNLASKTSQRPALASSSFLSGGTAPSVTAQHALSQLDASADASAAIEGLNPDTGRALADYLRQPGYGLFFDPTRNHDAWLQPAPLSEQAEETRSELLMALDARFPRTSDDDSVAERLEVDPDEVEAFREQIEVNDFEVPDATATSKTRGSAQKAFAEKVKANYGRKCAITGVATRDFLVAAHVVPWSEDRTIRLDPSNGICLSLLVDRAFEKGYLLIDDDYSIRIDWGRVGSDDVLRRQLEPYHEKRLNVPASGGPRLEYLQRRRALAIPIT